MDRTRRAVHPWFTKNITANNPPHRGGDRAEFEHAESADPARGRWEGVLSCTQTCWGGGIGFYHKMSLLLAIGRRRHLGGGLMVTASRGKEKR